MTGREAGRAVRNALARGRLAFAAGDEEWIPYGRRRRPGARGHVAWTRTK